MGINKYATLRLTNIFGSSYVFVQNLAAHTYLCSHIILSFPFLNEQICSYRTSGLAVHGLPPDIDYFDPQAMLQNNTQQNDLGTVIPVQVSMQSKLRSPWLCTQGTHGEENFIIRKQHFKFFFKCCLFGLFFIK